MAPVGSQREPRVLGLNLVTAALSAGTAVPLLRTAQQTTAVKSHSGLVLARMYLLVEMALVGMARLVKGARLVIAVLRMDIVDPRLLIALLLMGAKMLLEAVLDLLLVKTLAFCEG